MRFRKRKSLQDSVKVRFKIGATRLFVRELETGLVWFKTIKDTMIDFVRIHHKLCFRQNTNKLTIKMIHSEFNT